MSLRQDCTGIVPEALLPLVPGRFDVVGDIAILQLPEALAQYHGAIARAIVSRRRNIRAVARKVAKVRGDDRTARFELLAGTGTTTLHREHGFSYRLDIAGTFFAPRLGTERRRIARLVRPKETVLVPFAGVGPFAIPAAAAGGIVTAVERNLKAFRYLEKNAAANRVSDTMTLVHGDAYDTSLLSCRNFDRAIIPAPYGQEQVLATLAPVVRTMGSIHLYLFKKKHEIDALARAWNKDGLTVTGLKRCGNIAPGVSRWVFDIVKEIP